MRVLGIESSCDETAAAVVSCDGAVLSHEVWSQVKLHQPFGGVVPEVGARAHLSSIIPVIDRALGAAGCSLNDLHAIAATCGPGLVGGLAVGAMTAKALAAAAGKPFLAVNHLEAHALMVRMHEPVPFPYLLLLVSGGHSQFLMVEGVGRYSELGSTVDDAVGECFDKVAKLLGLPYPGGPQVEQQAKNGDALRFSFPCPLIHEPGCRLSFSGLKTAVRCLVESLSPLSEENRADIAASFQRAAARVLVVKTRNAFQAVKDRGVQSFVVSGGVASNLYLRACLEDVVQKEGARFLAPPPSLCGDNGVMVAWAGVERFRLGLSDTLDFPIRPRWPLSDL